MKKSELVTVRMSEFDKYSLTNMCENLGINVSESIDLALDIFKLGVLNIDIDIKSNDYVWYSTENFVEKNLPVLKYQEIIKLYSKGYKLLEKKSVEPLTLKGILLSQLSYLRTLDVYGKVLEVNEY